MVKFTATFAVFIWLAISGLLRAAICQDSTDGDTNLIRADAGSYYAIDSTKLGHIAPRASGVFGGVTVSLA